MHKQQTHKMTHTRHSTTHTLHDKQHTQGAHTGQTTYTTHTHNTTKPTHNTHNNTHNKYSCVTKQPCSGEAKCIFSWLTNRLKSLVQMFSHPKYTTNHVFNF